MSLAFFRRAFGFKKGHEEQQSEEFLKNFHNEAPGNLSQLSKSFRKNALRLLILRNSPESIVFDSLLNKEQPQMPTFTDNGDKVTLHEAAFGAAPLSKDHSLRFSIKLHDFKASRQILITCVHTPSSRCTNSTSYTKRSSEIYHLTSSRSAANLQSNDRAVAVCLLINLDWIHQLPRSPNGNPSRFTLKSDALVSTKNHVHDSFSVPTQNSSALDFLPECLVKRFYFMIFEHFVQISVLIEALSENVVRMLNSADGFSSSRSRESTLDKSSIDSNLEIHNYFNSAFTDFQLAFKDICVPRLSRPVWCTLIRTSAAEQDEMDTSESAIDALPNVSSWVNQFFNYENMGCGPGVIQHESLAHSFVRGCLCIQIAKAIARDRGYFLGQIVTGILMCHHGWISTVQPKKEGFLTGLKNTEAMPGECLSGIADNNGNIQPKSNLLLDQLLTQYGCRVKNHDCDNAAVLNSSGNAFSTTVLHGQQRDRLLALLYLCTYFLRAPMLMHSREQLPDLGRADLFELELQRRRARHGSKGRRKSGSLLSSTGVNGSGTNVNRGYASSDPHDSGISSQEDLTAAVYSASAGSSPSHPSGMALCLTHRLTQDQCRLAEAAAHFVVNREAAAAAQLGFGQKMYGITDLSVLAGFPSSTIPKGHTWCASGHGRISSVAGILASDTSVFASAANAVASTLVTVPSNNATPRAPQLTEIPLLIEKSFDDSKELCWCLGPRNTPFSSGLSSPNGVVVNAPHVTLCNSATSVVSVRRSPNKNNGCSISSSNQPSSGAFRNGETSRGLSGANSLTCSIEAVQSPSTGYLSNTFSVENGFAAQVDPLGPYATTSQTDTAGIELGTVCYADMEEPLSPDADHAFHCQVGAGVMDRYTSGLALQATLENCDTFRQRLKSELYDWLRYASNIGRFEANGLSPLGALLRRRGGSNGGTTEHLGNACGRFNSNASSSSTSSDQLITNEYTCSALLVNVDASTVEVMSIGRRVERNMDSSRSSIMSANIYAPPNTVPMHQQHTRHGLHLLSSPTSSSRFTENHYQGQQRVLDSAFSSQGHHMVRGIQSSGYRNSLGRTAVERSSSTSLEDHSNNNGNYLFQSTKNLEPAPSLIRLLETVKLLVDRAGCAILALRHLEAGLQMFYTRSLTLVDLIITEGAELLAMPERMAAVVGCPRGDLPLLLSIARSHSCTVAAILQVNDIDVMDFR